MTGSLSTWLIDTLIYSGLLIALVLVLRRPVSRHFGPQVAYALWALPLLRFLMPPVVLPASLAPAEPAGIAEPMTIILSEAPAIAANEAAAIAPVGIELAYLLLPLWLGGAAVLLAWRARDYMRMRRDLLAEARPVGEAGNIRLVETPAVNSPVAFGVGDKVIALPPEFMAIHDISARDLAIAHELAHHRGYDLVANIAAQPLLALHWFNPLAWWGWRAMRRDQEAACDARVVAGKQRSERAAYAQVIAGFAAGPHLALAAPMATGMACPVLGEKSIIHRLRSLTMSDIPSGRKKLGIAAIATTALAALPLTASISYAQPDAPEIPEAPASPEVSAPPSIEAVDPDNQHRIVRVQVDRDDEDSDRHFIIRREFDPEVDVDMSELDESELETAMAELGISLEELEHLEGMEQHIQIAMVSASSAQAKGEHVRVQTRINMPRIEMDCDDQEGVARHVTEDGAQVTIICQTAINNQALAGLRQAQRALSRNSALTADQRDRIVRELEEAIEEIQSEGLSYAPKPVIQFRASNTVKMPRVPMPPAALRVTWTTSSQLRGLLVTSEEEAEECEEDMAEEEVIDFSA